MDGIMTEERIYTVSEAAKKLGISHDSVVRRIRAGKLKARQDGKVFRIRERDLEIYIRDTEVKPPKPNGDTIP